MPRLSVAGEIFTLYQRVVGAAATLVWLNMRYSVEAGQPFDPESLQLSGLGQDEIHKAISRLEAYGLLERDGDAFVVHEPLSREAFLSTFQEAKEALAEEAEHENGSVRSLAYDHQMRAENGAERVGAMTPSSMGAHDSIFSRRPEPLVIEPEPDKEKPVMRSPLSKKRKASRMLRLVEPTSGDPEPENPDMQAVMQIYHKRIGMIGPTQYEKLRFWIEEKGMEGAVVALAIEETVRSAEVPRISYLEGILRNWYNDGIRKLADLHERKRASRVLSGDNARTKERALEGTPNAAAYQSVSAELVAKWKELYPDEYDG